ncbi:MAG: DMT family transporter [Gemmatimonadota bacterium]
MASRTRCSRCWANASASATDSLGPTLLASFLFLAALRHLPASTASMLATAEPVVAALLGVAVLGEPLGLDTAAGVALVVGAAIMLGKAAHAHRRELAPETAKTSKSGV